MTEPQTEPYTPSTYELELAWTRARKQSLETTSQICREEFQRWLKRHDDQIIAERSRTSELRAELVSREHENDLARAWKDGYLAHANAPLTPNPHEH